MVAFRRICFDLDDTLIPNSFKYHQPIWRCAQLIAKVLGHKSPHPLELLKLHHETDIELVKTHGFGADRFPEGWVRTYECLAGRVGEPADPEVARRLRNMAKRFAFGPFEPFRGVKDVLGELLRAGRALHLITAGDEHLQKRKIAQAKLRPLFTSVHITGLDKKEVMRELAGDHPEDAMMVGDSTKSDILPAIELGMTAVFVPSPTWSFAHTEVDPSKYHKISSVRELPALLRKLSR